MQKPFFTIAVPSYKDTYLKECLDSILAQTYASFEVIVLNDASPKDLDSIVGSYNDPRIRYYKNEVNCGAVDVVNTWNKCLSLAKGDYIICMGDDDMLLPCCLQEYVSLIEKHPGLGVYHAWTEIIDEDSCFKNVTAARCEFESVYSFVWHRWNGRTQQYVGDFLYDVKKLREKGGFFYLPLAWGSDDITAIIAARDRGIANTQVPCFKYRINSETISSTGDVEIKIKSTQAEEAWIKKFLEEEPAEALDKKFYYCLNSQRARYFQKKKGLTIVGDLRRHSALRAIYWLVKHRKYDISLKTLAYSVIEALK